MHLFLIAWNEYFDLSSIITRDLPMCEGHRVKTPLRRFLPDFVKSLGHPWKRVAAPTASGTEDQVDLLRMWNDELRPLDRTKWLWLEAKCLAASCRHVASPELSVNLKHSTTLRFNNYPEVCIDIHIQQGVCSDNIYIYIHNYKFMDMISTRNIPLL